MRDTEEQAMRTNRAYVPETVAVRLTSRLKTWVTQRADAEEVSVSTLIRLLIAKEAQRDLQRREVVQDDRLSV